jgi:hypothetical protein
MTISREAKILIGIVALAGAAWLWINAFNQPAVNGALGQTAPLVGGSSSAEVPLSVPAQTAVDPAEATVVNDGVNDSEVGDANAVEPTAPVIPAPPTAAAPIPSGDARVAELPFLVTEPPLATPEADAEPTLQTTERPQELRATVNPFSPILIRAAPAPSQPASLAEPTIPAPTSDISIVEIPIPTAPDEPVVEVGPANGTANGVANGALVNGLPANGVTPTVSAPVPRPVTPEAAAGVSLPRPLPGGTLPTTPDILREVRASSQPSPIAAVPAPVNIGEVAALRLPQDPVVVTELPTAEEPEVEPLPLARTAPSPAVGQGDPLSAGISEMSRYLRDNNYRFTGAVIGPMSVGVFRSNAASAPIVVPLGQTLPNTEIVLTSLQGKQAEFTQGAMKYSLVLDLR